MDVEGVIDGGMGCEEFQIQAFSGNAAAATAHANRALRLSPFDPLAFTAHIALGVAAIQEARYDEAASFFVTALQANSRFSSLYFAQAIALALAGRVEEAKPIVRLGLELEPAFRTKLYAEIGMAPAIVSKLAEGGRLLGLPE